MPPSKHQNTSNGTSTLSLSTFFSTPRAASHSFPLKPIQKQGVAADCSYVTDKGGISQALSAILSNWNSASQVFESTFNVRLGVVKVKIQQTCTPLDKEIPWNTDCSLASYTISNRLSDFSAWRGSQSGDGMGLWHLMTKCSTQPSVGTSRYFSFSLL